MGEPSSSERLAYEVIRRVLGIEVEHYDTARRQGAVDGLIHYNDRRVGPLKVTSYTDADERELAARLAADHHSWPNPGAWWRTINIAEPDDINKLRDIYKRIITICEQRAVAEVDHLPWSVQRADADVQWLPTSMSTMHGHPGGGRSTRHARSDAHRPSVRPFPEGEQSWMGTLGEANRVTFSNVVRKAVTSCV